MTLKAFSLLFLVAAISSCGGGGGDGTASLPDYTGVWDVQYHLSTDECFIVASNVPGFVDQHILEQTGTVVDFTTLSPVMSHTTQVQGVVREDGTLYAADEFTKDAGGGVVCTSKTEISYQIPVEDQAQTLFSLQIACSDGLSCVSQGIGTAVRQPGNVPEITTEE